MMNFTIKPAFYIILHHSPSFNTIQATHLKPQPSLFKAKKKFGGPPFAAPGLALVHGLRAGRPGRHGEDGEYQGLGECRGEGPAVGTTTIEFPWGYGK